MFFSIEFFVENFTLHTSHFTPQKYLYLNNKMEKTCPITQQQYPANTEVKSVFIKKELQEIIKQKNPAWQNTEGVSVEGLNIVRNEYILQILKQEKEEIVVLDKKLLDAVAKYENKDNSPKEEENEDVNSTFGQRIADKVAAFGGSWTFIILFMMIIFVWININIFIFNDKGFDPYPFILLNLILSCLAALQAPVIMMSQNRQEEKDRFRAQNDYQINLKAETEIKQLHNKIDHLMLNYSQRMFEIQQIQIEMMEQILQKQHK